MTAEAAQVSANSAGVHQLFSAGGEQDKEYEVKIDGKAHKTMILTQKKGKKTPQWVINDTGSNLKMKDAKSGKVVATLDSSLKIQLTKEKVTDALTNYFPQPVQANTFQIRKVNNNQVVGSMARISTGKNESSTWKVTINNKVDHRIGLIVASAISIGTRSISY